MRRRVDPELLDRAPAAEAAPSLRDLIRINRFLGGHRVLLGRMREVAPPGPFTLLDVGAASGDAGRAVTAAFPRARVVSMDLHPQNLGAAAAPRLAADAFRPPFGAHSFDIVYCSMVLHHFQEIEIVRLLGNLAGMARRALVVNDLERNRFAYHFVPWTRWLFGWADVTMHDAPVSVQAGFRAGELGDLAVRAGLRGALVRRHLPWFRLSLVWTRR